MNQTLSKTKVLITVLTYPHPSTKYKELICTAGITEQSEWQNTLNQISLFGPQTLPLEKLPYKWSYVFRCDDREKPYTRMIEDWEIGALYLKERNKKGEEAASKSVRDKYLNEIANPKRDTRLFMGTRFPYNTWLVLGTFWPPKTTLELF